ncbi:hypothetical protein N6B72_13005 [Chryseobacterium soli]|uniref:hypothetical protein n=1 Tax=Chryseobacterium soli TaxID=445961 RepID=UPI0029554091|nr:hypothetical protein [Chryseobacterium soli]MDV7697843.1 hypothetical protein [Chryseobacterium soli]
MKKSLKIVLFIGSCMLLCSCPASSFVMYKLVGSDNDSYREYYDLIDGSDTIRAKVGVLHSFIDKKTYLTVKLNHVKEKKYKVFSTAYGEISMTSEEPYIFNKELKSTKKRDTVTIENAGKHYYFTR